ncbi:MAG: hypothetical protein MJZ19_09420 [Paludibacteraceae bacterium]|nr:hypothetical protein [Paludibacteraceae bacterium]
MGKIISSVILAVFLVLGGFVYYNYYFVFAEGVKSGQINLITKKGTIWKTYEGRLIQNGFKSQNQSVGSYVFDFSIEDESLAKKLELLGDGAVTLHYLEYKKSLPWRGYSNYVVDSIVVYSSNKSIDSQSSLKEEQIGSDMHSVKKQDNLGDYPTEWYE